MRNFNLGKCLLSFATALAFLSAQSLQAGTSANDSNARLDGATGMAAIQFGASTSDATSLYLYCKQPTSAGVQTCKWLLHAVCSAKGLTQDADYDSVCSLEFDTIDTNARTGGNIGTTAAGGGELNIGVNTTAALTSAIALSGGAQHTYAVDALNGVSGALSTATSLAQEGTLGAGFVAEPCVAFNGNDAVDVFTKDGTSWQLAHASTAVERLGFEILHANIGAYSDPSIGFETTAYSAEFDREAVIGTRNAGFVAGYTFTLSPHLVNASSATTCS